MYYNVINFIIVNIVTIIINKFEWVSLQDLLTLDPKAGQIRHGLGLRTQKNWTLPRDPSKLGPTHNSISRFRMPYPIG